ncbi:hypothetical protein L3Q67_01620 [Saccharothrix sp. AJ9571]|nr:hypothetical protein L3Q67_01620 [Saccharothrix sp. AJ9571]
MHRMRQYPDSAVEALLTEYRALFFNPRSKLFGAHSLHERLIEHGVLEALDRFERYLDRAQWTVYDVRRLFFPREGDPARKGPGWRSTRALFTGTPAQAHQWMRIHADTEVDDGGRMWLRRQDPAVPYPKVEHFIGTCLAGTADKERRSSPPDGPRSPVKRSSPSPKP